MKRAWTCLALLPGAVAAGILIWLAWPAWTDEVPVNYDYTLRLEAGPGARRRLSEHAEGRARAGRGPYARLMGLLYAAATASPDDPERAKRLFIEAIDDQPRSPTAWDAACRAFAARGLSLPAELARRRWSPQRPPGDCPNPVVAVKR
jgi:hypothetical protein